MKLPQCRFCMVLDKRGEVPGGMDPFLCFEKGSFKEFHVGNDFHYLYTMLDGSLSITWNGLGIIPLCVSATGAKLTLESGSKNKVQDISGCWMRRTMINYPSVAFVRSQLCKKIS